MICIHCGGSILKGEEKFKCSDCKNMIHWDCPFGGSCPMEPKYTHPHTGAHV